MGPGRMRLRPGGRLTAGKNPVQVLELYAAEVPGGEGARATVFRRKPPSRPAQPQQGGDAGSPVGAPVHGVLASKPQGQ